MKLHSARPPYDPRPDGANCDACPLNGRVAVPPTRRPNAKLIILGEGPGHTEELHSVPFVGESGRLLDSTIARIGASRASCHVTNAMLCRGPGKLSPGEWKAAIAACRPRLQRELEGNTATTIAALGARALQAVTGKAKILEWIGAPLQGVAPFERFQILPMVHPAFILRGKPEWTPVFAIHLQRAWRLAHGQLPAYHWPKIVIGDHEPELLWALECLATAAKVAVDVETAGLDPKSDLLNVGIASKALDLAVSIHWQSASDPVKALVGKILADTTVDKVFHNGQFDVTVLENN